MSNLEETEVLKEKPVDDLGDVIWNLDAWEYEDLPDDVGQHQYIGYARTSTEDQNLDRQVEALEEFGCDRIYKEKISALSEEREELVKAMNYLRSGDVLVVNGLSRIGRRTGQLCLIGAELCRRGIGIKSLSEPIDCNLHTSQGAFTYELIASLAQQERERVHERTMQGIYSARRSGKIGGRPVQISNEQVLQAARMKRKPDLYTVGDICDEVGFSKKTLYKYVSSEGNVVELPRPGEASVEWLNEHRDFLTEEAYEIGKGTEE